MTYRYRDPGRLSPARLASLPEVRDSRRGPWTDSPEFQAFCEARNHGVPVWKAAIDAGVSQYTGRRMERQRKGIA